MAIAAGFKYLDEKLVRKLNSIEGGVSKKELALLLDDALDLELGELPAGLLLASKLQVYTSAAGAGGGATEAMTVTGLSASDTVLSVTQSTAGANSLPLLAYGAPGAGTISATWSADPGAGSVIKVLVLKA